MGGMGGERRVSLSPPGKKWGLGMDQLTTTNNGRGTHCSSHMDRPKLKTRSCFPGVGSPDPCKVLIGVAGLV